jgi:hypothetical protein
MRRISRARISSALVGVARQPEGLEGLVDSVHI